MHKKHWFFFPLLWSNSANRCYFHVALKSHPPPFCKVPAKCCCSVARRWKVTAGWHGNWERVTAGGAGNSTQRSDLHPCPASIAKYQSPEVTSTRKRLKTNQPPRPLPGGFLPGMGEGCWKVGIVLSPSTRHRPLSVPWLRVWRWERRECFRRLTHHIQARSRRPSWAPDGRVGLHSWWARWLSHASYPWCSRHWSPRFHRRPKRRTKAGGRERREAENRAKRTGEDRGDEVNRKEREKTAGDRKRRRDSRGGNAENKWQVGRKVHTGRDRRHEGSRGQKEGEIEKLIRWEVSRTVNSTTATFSPSKSTVSRKSKLCSKAATVTPRDKNEGGGKTEVRRNASMPQVICQCCLRRGNSSLADYGSFTDTSLCLTKPLLLISPLTRCTNTCTNVLMYIHSHTP